MSTLLLVLLVPRFLPPTYVPLGLGLHKSMEMASSAMSQTLAGVWLDHAKEADSDEGREGGGGEEDAGQETATKGLLRAWLLINVLQLVCVYALWCFEKRRRSARETGSGSEGGTRRVGGEEGKASGRRYEAEEYERLPLNDLPALDSSDDDDSDFDDEHVRRSKLKMPSGAAGSRAGGARGASVQGSDPERQQQGLQAAAGPESGPSSALARTNAERRRSKMFLVSSLGWIGLVWVVFLVDAYLDLF